MKLDATFSGDANLLSLISFLPFDDHNNFNNSLTMDVAAETEDIKGVQAPEDTKEARVPYKSFK